MSRLSSFLTQRVWLLTILMIIAIMLVPTLRKNSKPKRFEENLKIIGICSLVEIIFYCVSIFTVKDSMILSIIESLIIIITILIVWLRNDNGIVAAISGYQVFITSIVVWNTLLYVILKIMCKIIM